MMVSKTAVHKDRFPSQFEAVATSFAGLEPLPKCKLSYSPEHWTGAGRLSNYIYLCLLPYRKTDICRFRHYDFVAFTLDYSLQKFLPLLPSVLSINVVGLKKRSQI